MFLFALVCAGVSSALLIGPAAYHRMAFPYENGDRLLKVGTWMARSGLVVLALAMSAVVFVVADMLLSRGVALATAGGLLALMAALWLVLPIVERGREARAEARVRGSAAT